MIIVYTWDSYSGNWCFCSSIETKNEWLNDLLDVLQSIEHVESLSNIFKEILDWQRYFGGDVRIYYVPHPHYDRYRI